MEFLIEMKKTYPCLKLRSIHANDLSEAVFKVVVLVVDYCAENVFDFKVKSLQTDAHMVDLDVSFDKRKINILVYNPQKYPDVHSARFSSKVV